MKNFAQDGRRLPLNPAVWYRGWTAGILMSVPMTVVQFGAARRLERLFETRDADVDAPGTTTHQKETRAPMLSPAARFAAAGLAGGVSGLCVQPLDVLMTQQQKFGGSLVATARRMREMSRVRKKKNDENENAALSRDEGKRRRYSISPFARGVCLVVAREAFYSCGYLGAVPLLREARPDLPFAACAIACGMGAAVLTQPLDTVKTVMQSNLTRHSELPKNEIAATGGEGAAKLGGLGYRDTAAALVREGGVLSLWRGLAPRGARVVGATFILSLVNERAGEAVAGWREGER